MIGRASDVFSTGLCLAGLVGSLNLLQDSWNAISEPEQQINQPFLLHSVQRVSLRDEPATFLSDRDKCVTIKEFHCPNYNIIAIVTPPVIPDSLKKYRELVPLLEIPDFRFLCSNSNPTSLINRAAMSLFKSVQEALSTWTEQIVNSANSKDPVSYIITGHCLGGSIASLFTLLLLIKLNPEKSILPLCITFGCPLLGDSAFQQDVSQYPAWNSCFLHVVHKDDCIPKQFLHPPTTNQIPYKPFGTTLLCSESGGACFEAPESVVQLLTSEIVVGNQKSRCVDYKNVIGCLEKRYIYGDCFRLNGQEADLYKAGVTIQVTAVGLETVQKQKESADALIEDIKKHELGVIRQRKKAFDPVKELNDMNLKMGELELFIVHCRAKKQGPGPYDYFKNLLGSPGNKFDVYKTELEVYWQGVVKDAEKKIQIWALPLPKQWLFAGNDFRKIVEPLEIADYYKNGRKDYVERGRFRYFTLLEQWMKNYCEENPHPRAGLNPKSSLMEDSCFYARVEDAIRVCTSRNRGVSLNSSQREKLIEFEDYVMDLIKKHAVSQDIFREDCTYMNWWRVYEKILEKQTTGHTHNSQSELVCFMRNESFKNYIEGI